MPPLLYGELTPWYFLLDPTADHLDEAASYQHAIERASEPRAETLLELGAGAGNNAFHLKQRFRCTLTDVSASMQRLSRGLNPDCEHVLGDMRTLRLGRTFDAVLLHDAVMYMTSADDLAAAMRTAFVHTRPGGAVVIAPDYYRETFKDTTNLHTGDDGRRSMRCLEWSWDPDPGDDTFVTEFAFLLRDGSDLTVVHDRHVEGLFPRAVWERLLADAGFEIDHAERPGESGGFDEIFLCRRRGK
jgi:SAM-dependent methyltransferase